MTSRSRNIELYIIRHGERLDEAIWRDFKSKHKNPAKRDKKPAEPPATDTFDPPLTARGHHQAHHAFARLTATLLSEEHQGSDGNDKPRRRTIAVFSSPLRRVVGTALMIGTVDTRGGNGNVNVNVNGNERALVFPPVPGDVPDDSGAIPVTILNELANSAAAVYRHGGVEELVPKGFLRCANTRSNDGTDASPFVRALRTMPASQWMDNNDNQTSPPDCNCRPVQFWKRQRDEAWSWQYAPMSEPIRPGSLGREAGTDGFSYLSVRKKRNQNRNRNSALRMAPTNRPLLAVDEAVTIAADRGCNVCIVVAHRETIRDLATKRCHRFESSLEMPYGCIGSFAASVLIDSHEKVRHVHRYRFHGVWPIERFGTEAIPGTFPDPGLEIHS
mmetsp:Transcript_6950/g.20138  ORF Transcript_6950/g.20138 Transcript_6950/m.20138 type:complete len:388 (+) Transcript_6950:308-1471(+)